MASNTALVNKPFKLLGNLIYPSLKDRQNVDSAAKKVENLMNKTDKVPLDGRYKAWIYQHSILQYLSWDFMMVEIPDTTIEKMEACVTRHLKNWL